MKPARLIVLGIALVAGLFAFMLTKRTRVSEVQVAQQVEAPVSSTEVLIAASEIPVGRVIQPSDMKWEPWPSAASATGQMILRKDSPKAIEEAAGSIARGPFLSGEPIRTAKLIKSDGKGFMAAILQPGMRAVATEVAPETGAGGFILPNDRVDVILTRRLNQSATPKPDELTHSTTTVLNNVRVLAIDQSVEDRSRDRSVIGRTATLELTPQQSEVLALARQLGILSLALRSLSESSQPNAETNNPLLSNGGKGITVVKFGQASSQVSLPTNAGSSHNSGASQENTPDSTLSKPTN